MNEQQHPMEEPRSDEREQASREEPAAERPAERPAERQAEPRYDMREREQVDHETGATDRPEPAGEGNLFPELSEYLHRFDSLQAEFIDEPRSAVHKAESLIEEAVDRMMHTLHDRLRQIHDEAGSDGDTERMRVAMRSYRDVIHSLGGGGTPH